MDVILWLLLTYAPLSSSIISARDHRPRTRPLLGGPPVRRRRGILLAIGFGQSDPGRRVIRRGTRWRINWLPLGGFVKFVGESAAARRMSSSADPHSKPLKQKRRRCRMAESLPRPAGAKEGVETTLYDNQILVGKPLHRSSTPGSASPSR